MSIIMPIKHDQQSTQQQQDNAIQSSALVSSLRQQHWPSSNMLSLSSSSDLNTNTIPNENMMISEQQQQEEDKITDLELDYEESDVAGVVMDELVSTLSHKLCLSQSQSQTLKSKSCHSLCRHHRMSPYMVHNNSAINRYGNINMNNTDHDYQQQQPSCYCLNCKYFNSANNVNTNHSHINININTHAKHQLNHANKHQDSECDSDVSSAYQMMQELIKEGALIKEAVKRLQLKKNKIQNDEMSYYDCGVEVEEIGKALGGKNRSRSGLMNENDLDMNLINA